MYCGISTRNPKAAATVSACTAFAPETLRDRNIRNGSNGVRARRCRIPNEASKTMAAAKVPRVRTDTQPYPAVSTIPYTPAISPVVTRTAPIASTPALSPIPASSASRNQPATIAAMPMGTLTKKIQRQLSAWVSTPPSTRPIEAPPAPVKL
jgi:hypothetical protein